MKYKVGDKVRYNSGEWQFYGTVSAVLDNSINPCYRLNVERMEKSDCKFSITQFEFELEPYREEMKSEPAARAWGLSEIEFVKKYYGVLSNEDVAKMLNRTVQEIENNPWKPAPEPETAEIDSTRIPQNDPSPRKPSAAWHRNLEAYLRGEKSAAVNAWAFLNRKGYRAGKLTEDKLRALEAANFNFDIQRKDTEDAQAEAKPGKDVRTAELSPTWLKNLKAHTAGDKSNPVRTWASHIRKLYRNGTLSQVKIDMLTESGFIFQLGDSKRKAPVKAETQVPSTILRRRTTSNKWVGNLEAYARGEMNRTIRTWVADVRKYYRIGKLSQDKIDKLREINFVFNPPKRAPGARRRPRVPGYVPPVRPISEIWNKNLEDYVSGKKSKAIRTWASDNKKYYKSGKLSMEKLDKLIAINFPFDVPTKRDEAWDTQLNKWKEKTNRKSIEMQRWVQRNVKQYEEGTLPIDKVVRLKEAGVLQ